MSDTKINYRNLDLEIEELVDYIDDHKEDFSKNPNKTLMIPSDVALLVEEVIKFKYTINKADLPDEVSALKGYQQFTDSIKNVSTKKVQDYPLDYIDKESLNGITPAFLLSQFKKALAGHEHRFPNIIAYAEKSQTDRISFFKGLTGFDTDLDVKPHEIYSATIEQAFVTKAASSSLDVFEANAPVIKKEHSDIQILPGEYEDRKFKTRKLDVTGNTSEKLKKLGERMIQVLEENDLSGMSPWQDPVFTKKCLNPKTGRSFGVENKVILNDEAAAKGYPTSMFLGYNEAKSLGLIVPYGTSGTPIIQRFGVKKGAIERTDENGVKTPVLDANGEPAHFWKRSAKLFTVYNEAQLLWPYPDKPDPRIKWREDYANPIKITASNQHELEVMKKCLFNAITIPVERGGTDNYYSPARNLIHLADEDLFKSVLNEVSVTFHEWAHSLGHKDEKNRETLYKYNISDVYRGMEEIVANVSAQMLMSHFGLDNSELHDEYHNNEDAYNLGWAMPVFKKDPSLIVDAFYMAEDCLKEMVKRIEVELENENVLDMFLKNGVRPTEPTPLAEAANEETKPKYNNKWKRKA
ncbi:antirestriction protein ArdC [Pseudomonas baetica]|uniref:Antirestriction protein ArdC n=1 Tax=Pseudomonas baetica TaxID=674054 RepID=A0ABX4Q3L1_9PSED|nr:zincin-like metallopeptidase domain-containing protein [Pseudomonas baetica]PKA71343.1 antirestriction protein ArdC [Pseudomonas baetica]PTC19842.1 hypothetical protein C0J26_07545 [Pseudomonas baetica]